MATPFYPSTKKTRQQVFATQKVVIEQGAILRVLDTRTREQGAWIEAFNNRGFLGRLRWLLTGR